jgi:hypothetical protein
MASVRAERAALRAAFSLPFPDVGNGDSAKADVVDGEVVTIEFSNDDRYIATGMSKTTILLWDIIPSQTLEINEYSHSALEYNLTNMASNNAVLAYNAITILSMMGNMVVPYIKEMLMFNTEYKDDRIQQAIDKLDNDDISIREQAHNQIQSYGVAAEPLLLKAVEESRSAEVRSRIDNILLTMRDTYPIPNGEPLNRHRMIQLLERIGSNDARQVLKMIYKRPLSIRERRESKASLERLEKRENDRDD